MIQIGTAGLAASNFLGMNSEVRTATTQYRVHDQGFTPLQVPLFLILRKLFTFRNYTPHKWLLVRQEFRFRLSCGRHDYSTNDRLRFDCFILSARLLTVTSQGEHPSGISGIRLPRGFCFFDSKMGVPGCTGQRKVGGKLRNERNDNASQRNHSRIYKFLQRPERYSDQNKPGTRLSLLLTGITMFYYQLLAAGPSVASFQSQLGNGYRDREKLARMVNGQYLHRDGVLRKRSKLDGHRVRCGLL